MYGQCGRHEILSQDTSREIQVHISVRKRREGTGRGEGKEGRVGGKREREREKAEAIGKARKGLIAHESEFIWTPQMDLGI